MKAQKKNVKNKRLGQRTFDIRKKNQFEVIN